MYDTLCIAQCSFYKHSCNQKSLLVNSKPLHDELECHCVLTRWEELCASSVTLATRCFVSCDFSFLISQSNAIRYFFSFWYSVCNSSNNILCDSSVQDMGWFFLWKILNIFKNRTSRTVNFGVCHSSLTVINLWLILFYLYSYFPHSVLFWSKL